MRSLRKLQPERPVDGESTSEPASAGEPDPWDNWLLSNYSQPLLLLSLAIACFSFWSFRLPQVAMVGLASLQGFCWTFGLFAAVGLAWCGFTALRCAQHVPTSYRRRSFWRWFLPIVTGTYFVLSYHLPMHFGFYISQSAFEAAADEALKAPSRIQLLAGRSVGLYTVEEVVIIGKTVVIYLDKRRGNVGFARVPNFAHDLIANPPDGLPNYQQHDDFPKLSNVTDDSVGTRISGDWFVVYSFYWRGKVGWS